MESIEVPAVVVPLPVVLPQDVPIKENVKEASKVTNKKLKRFISRTCHTKLGVGWISIVFKRNRGCFKA